ncbi:MULTISPECIES: hypothetical protein [Nitrosomonas]|nr:hypothetical protein [Nitrosomonas halophila]HRQ04617.1 hypothetical protein [Nitrosomonas halophila]
MTKKVGMVTIRKGSEKLGRLIVRLMGYARAVLCLLATYPVGAGLGNGLKAFRYQPGSILERISGPGAKER